MPKRGDGAAMLRDLRDEERPPLGEEPPAPTKSAARDAEGVDQTNQSYDNMTNKQTEQKVVKQSDNPVRQKTVRPVRQKSAQFAGQSADGGVSVADMIRRRAERRDGAEVLKTVTLKLSPALDERIERFCFENRMKKQEFWAEAAALYFETVGPEAGEGER